MSITDQITSSIASMSIDELYELNALIRKNLLDRGEPDQGAGVPKEPKSPVLTGEQRGKQ